MKQTQKHQPHHNKPKKTPANEQAFADDIPMYLNLRRPETVHS